MPHSQPVQSLARGMQILEAVCASDGGLTLQDVARATGLKAPTAFNLARTLVSMGFLEKVPNPIRYRMGSAISEMARRRRGSDLLRRAPRALQDLHEAAGGATAILAQGIAGDVMKSLAISRDRPGVIQRPLSEPMIPFGSASSMLYQALWTEEERAAYYRRYPFWDYGAPLWRSERKLAAILDDIRRKGIAELRIDRTGVFTVAAPITGESGELLAAIGATLRLSESGAADHRRLVRRVRQAALALSTAEKPENP